LFGSQGRITTSRALFVSFLTEAPFLDVTERKHVGESEINHMQYNVIPHGI